MRLNRRDMAVAAASAVVTGLAATLWTTTRPPRDRRDVRAFGARGDGVQDDSPAIQNAIDSGTPELWFPPGTYRLGRSLRPASRQHWRGDGPTASVLVFGGSADQPPFNLLHGDHPLADFSLTSLGFHGGRPAQLVNGRDGQQGFALYLRGALERLSIRQCRFDHFGDGRAGGGGMILGPAPGTAVPGPADIVVEGCVFADNGNVPGLYISASDAGPGPSAGIRIHGNSFGGSVGSLKVQNAVYVLGGGPGRELRQVDISDNRFDLTAPVDAAIETNWIEGFSIAGNIVDIRSALPDSAAILIRDGSAKGVVGGNVISSDSDLDSLRGIALLNFQHPGRITDVVVAGNVVSGVAGAIAVDRGSSGVVVADNRLRGRDLPGGFGVRVVDAEAVRVSGNMISDSRHAVLLGHGDQPQSALRDVVVEHNHFLRCGGGGSAIVGALHPDGGLVAEAVEIRHNVVTAAAAGSPLLDPAWTMRLAQP
ncbi:right-handed parallel beta-helix repeat-containing protein [Magnetospirillum sp. 64-120]|uniref:right-handed parallel beta-helix repeat-containing protein n=1 Tax=Magnetospirillum sp. 64-120 TaxID=1895778 RepID=UPI000925B30F|nr:right-handed parallel beta-helix repeat-containing protein [Magnetospirillum sp. 64-120]OJX67158.1 MAG: hypothetical protein BGO92_01100 [Magnetospirillum sp. 64-120]